MPDHLPLKRVAERTAPAQLTNFPDIVQDRARDQQVRVHLWIKRRGSSAHPHQGHHMLEQAANPRVVQHLCRRCLPIGRPERLIVQKRKHQPAQVCTLELIHISAQLAPHLIDVELCRRNKIRRLNLR